MEGGGIEEREWVMMGAINLSAVLEYGKASSVIGRAGGFGGVKEGTNVGAGIKVMVEKATSILEDKETKMDIDDGSDFNLLAGVVQASPATSEVDEAVTSMTTEYPTPFKLAAQLTFEMLSHVLKNPMRKAAPFAQSTLNPYLTIILTFLATLTKNPATLAVLERSVPWDELAQFFTTIPHTVTVSQGLNKPGESERWIMLTTGCVPPLPEDWCLRGMEWVRRRVFEGECLREGTGRAAKRRAKRLKSSILPKAKKSPMALLRMRTMKVSHPEDLEERRWAMAP